jgi:hypothetical protein
MVARKPIPRVEDPVTDRAIRAVGEMVSDLVSAQDDIPQTPYTKAQVVPLVTLRAAPNVSIDGSLSNNFRLVLDQNVKIANPTGVKPGQIINVSVIQDGTGSRLVTFGSAWKFAGGAPTATTTADGIDLISVRVETVDNGGAATMLIGSYGLAHA